MTQLNSTPEPSKATNETHIGSITGQVHTGSGNITVSTFTAGGSVSTKEEFVTALRTLQKEIELAHQQGLPEDTAEDLLTEIEAAEKEATKDAPKADRITGRLERAQSLLTAGAGVVTAATNLTPAIGNAIDTVRKIFGI